MCSTKKNSCPLCNGDDISQIGIPKRTPAVEKFIDKDYMVVKCTNCKFYYVSPEISFTTEQWRELYGDHYFVELVDWHAKKREKDRKQRLKWLQDKSKRKIQRFLDIGCGEGLITYEALKLGWEPYCLDIYDNRIKMAKNSKIKFELNDLLSARYPDNFFDAVYLDSVLEHVLAPIGYLKKIHRILKPEGVAYIGVPNEDSIICDLKKFIRNTVLRSRLSSRMSAFNSPYHVVGFTKKSFSLALKTNGFRIEKLRNFAGLNEWREFKPFSKLYFLHLLTVPVYVATLPFNKLKYLDAIVSKN